MSKKATGKASDDKTFGMKNKKGKSAQKAQNEMKNTGKSKQDLQKEAEKRAKKEQKKLEEKEAAERERLFKQAPTNKIQQKAPPGVDPKSVVCLNFKAGKCVYGDKCKFSHDLTIERKAEKRDIYSDARDSNPDDDMANWDETKLAEVVAKKAIGKPHNPTAGICKHFLNAVEARKYGWFWECPNGEKCQYRHALPPGFVLKRDQKKEDKKTEPAIEDTIEEERRALPDNGTPMTHENFLKWKEKRAAAREKEIKKFKAEQNQNSSGRKTGRQVFEESGTVKLDGEEEEEGEDLTAMLKAKKEEEDRLDQENAAMVEQMQKEMAELDKEGEKRVEAEIAQIQKEKEDAEKTGGTTSTSSAPSTAPSTNTTAEKTLEGVDTAVFAEDENLPEFDDE